MENITCFIWSDFKRISTFTDAFDKHTKLCSENSLFLIRFMLRTVSIKLVHFAICAHIDSVCHPKKPSAEWRSASRHFRVFQQSKKITWEQTFFYWEFTMASKYLTMENHLRIFLFRASFHANFAIHIHVPTFTAKYETLHSTRFSLRCMLSDAKDNRDAGATSTPSPI